MSDATLPTRRVPRRSLSAPMVLTRRLPLSRTLRHAIPTPITCHPGGSVSREFPSSCGQRPPLRSHEATDCLEATAESLSVHVVMRAMTPSTTNHDPERSVKRVAARLFARSTFLHAPFTSSHGAIVFKKPQPPCPRGPQMHLDRLGSGQGRASTLQPPVALNEPGDHALGRRPTHYEAAAGPRFIVHVPRPRQPFASAAHPNGMRAHHTTTRRTHSMEPRGFSTPRGGRHLSSSAAAAADARGPPKAVPSRPPSFPSLEYTHASMMHPALYDEVAQPPASPSPARASRSRQPAPRTSAANVPSRQRRAPSSVGFAATAMTMTRNASPIRVAPPASGKSTAPVSDELISVTDAAIEILPLAVPSGISMALTFALGTIPLAFIGSHMGERYLNGASVGYFIISIVAEYPICGLTFALDTLVSHEYGRNNTSDVLGLLLQRGILVNLAFAVPVCFVLTNYSHPILSSIYGVELAVIASDFLRFTPLFLIPLVFFTAFSKFCANQMLPQIPMIAMTFGLIATPLAQQQLTHLGVEGSMLGMAVAAWVQLLVVIMLTFAKKETRQTFGAIRIGEALDWEDVSAYLKLALPSALFVAAEGSAFDMSVLLAASISDAQGAAWSAILNSCLPFVSVAGGLSAAACAKVGSSLGAGYPADARRYAFMGVLIASVCSVVNSGIIWTFFDAMLRFYGTEGAALEVANSLLPIVPLMHIADSVQFAFQGVFSGCGQNHKGALILLSSLWAIGFPASCVLAFWLGLGVRGVVMGLTIGLIVESPCMIWAAYRMDWQQLAEDAQEEALEDEEDEEEEEQLFDEVTDGDELVQDEEEAI